MNHAWGESPRFPVPGLQQAVTVTDSSNHSQTMQLRLQTALGTTGLGTSRSSRCHGGWVWVVRMSLQKSDMIVGEAGGWRHKSCIQLYCKRASAKEVKTVRLTGELLMLLAVRLSLLIKSYLCSSNQKQNTTEAQTHHMTSLSSQASLVCILCMPYQSSVQPITNSWCNQVLRAM